MMSSTKSPLVPGGVLKSKGSGVNVEFISHTLPDIRDDAFVLGVCGVREEVSSPFDDGWFLSDFFAFNFLLHGLGNVQEWLACTKPTTLLEKHGEYLHGNPFMERKVVLSYPLLENHQISEVTVVSPDDILDEFLARLERICRHAREKKAPVVVFIFGHGDKIAKSVYMGGNDHWLSMDSFRQAIGEDVAVTVVNTACFSGGWSVNPQLNITSMTAAGPKRESESWAASNSIGRFCGSIYATALIQALSDVSSPLVITDEIPNPSGSLQPLQPTGLQTKTFNEFARTIHKTLLTRVDRFGYLHDIHFSAQDDEWEKSWTGRAGIPLIHFEKRWSSLESRFSSSPPSSTNRDPSASNLPCTSPPTTFEPISRGKLGGLFGGTTRSQRRHVRTLARSLLDTCPGSWTLGYGPLVRGKLSRYVKEPIDELGETANVFYLCEYRFSMMRYADMLLECQFLPRPGGLYCSEFYYQEWMTRAIQCLDLDVSSLHDKIVDLLDEHQVFPLPTSEQGPPFYHPTYYVTASLIQGYKSMEDTIAKVASMGSGKQILTVDSPIWDFAN